MYVTDLPKADKLNFLIQVLEDKPELLDKYVDMIASELDKDELDGEIQVLYIRDELSEQLETAFNDKNNKAPGECVLGAIVKAYLDNRLIPDWAGNAFVNAHKSYVSYQSKTAQEAFKLMDRRNFATRRRNYALVGPIVRTVTRLRQQGHPLEREKTFERVGDSFGMSGSAVEKIYQNAVRGLKKPKN